MRRCAGGAYHLRIPEDAVIPADKVTGYLLAPRPWDDKSRFLARGGFTRDKPEALHQALRELARSAPAVEDGANEYGLFLRQDGELTGPRGRALPVTLIWLRWHLDGTVHLVTVKPRRRYKG